MLRIEIGQLILEAGREGELFTLCHRQALKAPCRVECPAFEVDGLRRGGFVFTGEVEENKLERQAAEWKLHYRSAGSPALDLTVGLRAYPGSEIVRMYYQLTSVTPAQLTKQNGQDHIHYFRLASDWFKTACMDEIQLSHFDPVAHTYQPLTVRRSVSEIYAGLKLVGPVVILHNGEQTLLVAYEHGADAPQSFFDYQVSEDKAEKSLALAARQGNYYAGQPLGPGQAFESVWFELGLSAAGGVSEFMPRYRRFFLEEVSQNVESRQPYIYYNTWNYQERQKYFKDRPYLESMTEARIIRVTTARLPAASAEAGRIRWTRAEPKVRRSPASSVSIT